METTLRPITPADLDRYDEWRASSDGTGAFQWFGFSDSKQLRKRFEESGLIDAERGTLAIAAPPDGCVGRLEWFKSAWGPPSTSSCWTIAIAVGPEFRGRGIGTAAQHALVAYLFRHTTLARIQAYTDVANVAERRALMKAGFAEEGVLRAAQWRDGAFHDQVLYSVVRA